MRTRSPVLTVLVAALVVLGAPAASAEPIDRYRATYDGHFASAAWEACTMTDPEVGYWDCESASLFLSQTLDERTGKGQRTSYASQLCLDLNTSGSTPARESGCTTTFDAQFARDLSTATLTASVPVERYACDEWWCYEPTGEIRIVEVSAEWTALGPLEKSASRSRSSSPDMPCASTYTHRGAMRYATASALIDGVEWTADEISWWSGAVLGTGRTRISYCPVDPF